MRPRSDPGRLMAGGEPAALTVSQGGWSLAGESTGEGGARRPAARDHRDAALRRSRLQGPGTGGHTGSSPTTPEAMATPTPRRRADGYGYPRLVSDLDAVVSSELGEHRPSSSSGHSMGAHTAVAYALRNPAQVAGLVVIGPVYTGVLDAEAIADWDRLAEGLERGGRRLHGRARPRSRP